MIIINSAKSKKEENTKVKSKIKSHAVKQKESFDVVLKDKIAFEFEGALEELLNDFREEEEQFLKNQSLYYLNRYKSIVEKILKTIQQEGFETAKLRRLRRDRADFVIIKKINSKLFDIAKQITGKDNKAFNLFKTIEEIRGLVFDLLF